MPRRKKKSSAPLAPILGVFLVTVAAVLAGYFVLVKDTGGAIASDPNLTELDSVSFSANSQSLRGNTYRLSGTVAEKVAWDELTGELLSVESESGLPIPVLIPAELGNTEVIEKGQSFVFKVQIDRRGIAIAEAIEKS
ncbi:MAG: hypothetical protein AAF555_05985 [Verrucomicrobiota bacterium]